MEELLSKSGPCEDYRDRMAITIRSRAPGSGLPAYHRFMPERHPRPRIPRRNVSFRTLPYCE